MKTLRRIYRHTPALFQVLALGVMLPWLAALAMAVSPDLHEHVHHDACHEDHECVVTHLQAGDFGDLVPPPAFLGVPDFICYQEPLAREIKTWLPATFLNNGILEHAPPAAV